MTAAFDALRRDLRQALRRLLRSPGFAAVSVLTLALGIGATTAAYSAVAVSLTARIPVRDLDRVVALYSSNRANGQTTVVVSPADFVAWSERQQSFEALGATLFDGVNLSGLDQPVRAGGAFVSASNFDAAGVEPMIGRAFTPEENRPGAARVAILSNRFWRTRFDGQANAVGREILIDGQTTTIVGVMRPDDYTPDVVLPLTIDPASSSYHQRSLTVMARLRPGVTIEDARADMDVIAAQLEREQPDTHRGWAITTQPYGWEFTGPGERIVFALLALTALAVLLIACANIANLLLARGMGRSHEMAVRAALGASRARLISQMLTESVVLAAAGGVLGLLFAFAGLRLLVTTFFPSGLPLVAADRTFVDMGVLTFTVGISIFATLLFGLFPAAYFGRLRHTMLATGMRTAGGRATSRLRAVLVTGEVAAAVVLLVTATLFMRTLTNLRSIEPGFDTDNLLLMEMALPANAYGTTESTTAFYDRVIDRLTASPGVVAAGAAERVPVEGGRLNPNRTIEIEGRPAVDGEPRTVDDITVTAGYLETLGVRLREGRLLTRSDGGSAPLAVVISETTARYWGQESPIGARLRLGDEPSPEDWRTVVGVVADVRNDDVDMPPPPHVYVPATQRLCREMVFMTRVNDDPLTHVAAARAAVAAQDPDLPIYDIQSMDQLLLEDLQGTAVLSAMTTAFGALALALAAVGLYGMVAYSVAQRTRELAVRIAVGAQAGDVMRSVLAGGLGAVTAGLMLGLAAGLAMSQVLSVVLYGVSPTDPSTYVFAAAVLLAAALLACLIPARRALHLDPVVALRTD